MGTSDNHYTTLEETAVSSLKLFKWRLTSGKAKTLQSKPVVKPRLVFTDGAWNTTVIKMHVQIGRCYDFAGRRDFTIWVQSPSTVLNSGEPMVENMSSDWWSFMHA